MTKLKDKVTNALNETRMLILGAQVLLGFQVNAAFRPRFDQISAQGRTLDLLGMALMMTVVALLIAPGPYHRIVEDGRDSPGIHRFATQMAEWAPVPFTLAIGLDVFIVAEIQFDTRSAVIAGAGFVAFCALIWYGLGLARRWQQGGTMASTADHDTATSLSEKLKTLLTESRVILPGAQALLGFQFAAFLSAGFEHLPETAKLAHFAALIAIAVATILLVAPAAYHRLAADGEDRPDVLRFGNAVVLSALPPLAAGLAAEFYVVGRKVGYGAQAAAIAAGVALAGFMALWFLYPLLMRGARHLAANRRLPGKARHESSQQL
jgi:hypothetical protein